MNTPTEYPNGHPHDTMPFARNIAMSSFSNNNWDKYNSGRDNRRRDDQNDWQEDFADMRNKWRKRRQDRYERDLDRGKEYRTRAGEIVGEIIDTVMDAVDSAMETSKANRARLQHERANSPGAVDRYREETYKRLVKKLQQAERKLESSKRGVVFSSIMSVCFGIGMIVGDADLGVPALVFAGMAAMTAYGVREHRQKFFRLQQEHQEFLTLAPASSPPMSSASPRNFVLMEKAVLRYAYEHNGKVYPELLVIESEFSLSEVEQFLKHAVEKRIAAVEVDANGRAFYYFSSLDNSDPYSALNQTLPPT
ncbi:MAG: hypothetical protein ACOVSW_13440 [Candidatus Kapaibacteriota bacterium]|jgi:hypothetical protein